MWITPNVGNSNKMNLEEGKGSFQKWSKIDL